MKLIGGPSWLRRRADGAGGGARWQLRSRVQSCFDGRGQRVSFRSEGIHGQYAGSGPWTVDKCTATMAPKASSSIFTKRSHLDSRGLAHNVDRSRSSETKKPKETEPGLLV